MKKKKLKRCISTMLVALMIITSMPDPALAMKGRGSVQDEIDRMAFEQFVNSFVVLENPGMTPGKISEAAQQMTINMGTFFDRFGGLMSITSGVIGILQLAGVIEDPTTKMLSQILDEVYKIQEQIAQIDKKLDDIHGELVQIAVSQEEKDRSNNATRMIGYWNDFNTNYCDPLDDKIEEYKGKINAGIKAWWNQDSHDGVRVLYTIVDGETEMTYPDSESKYSDGCPAEAGNGELVDVDKSFGVPAEYIPNTKTLSFNVNTYRSIFEAAMASKIKEAANAKKLDASGTFYTAWNALSDSEKNDKAKIYAADILNTQIYLISCDVMSENDAWVIEVTNAYRKYCDNILKQNSGINAMLNAMYLSHGFEGEIKDDLSTFCDGMIVKAGMYGQFALSCACQDNMQSIQNREAILDQFAETVNSLAEKKTDAITGFDNYCYVTGTKVNFEKVTATAEMNGERQTDNPLARARCKAVDDWKITIPNMMNSVFTQVLYHQYQTTGSGDGSFAAYLNKNGTGMPEDYSGVIMTKYDGMKTFELNEGIEMINTQIDGKNNKSGQTFKINQGTQFADHNFDVHDKITYEGIDSTNGSLMLDQLGAARAFYAEASWLTSETQVFRTSNVIEDVKTTEETGGMLDREYGTWSVKHSADLDVLELEACMELNGDGTPENPFYAFGGPVLTPGVSNQIGPTYQDKRVALTDVSLKSSSFAYTGKAIKPAVTVKAGKKTVPASAYTVSYSDNKELGTGMITVTAKGDKYSGVCYQYFRIVPKGTALKTVKKKGTKATLKWKKQSAKMPSDRIAGYQIRYSTKSSMKNAKTVTAKGYTKTSKKIKKLKKNKKYYFQIRTYMKVGEETIYSKWSKKKAVK